MSWANARIWAIGAVALIMLGSIVVLLSERNDDAATSRREAKPKQATVEPTDDRPHRLIEQAPAVDPQPTAAKKDRAARDAMHQKIRTSLSARESDPAGGSSARRDDSVERDPANDELPGLDREYIRERIREDLMPAAIECYGAALQDNPKLGGKLVMSFAILGEADVGGVVEDAQILDEESTLADPFVRECMRESLMAITFDPPADGGRLEVTYPFYFEPGEDEDAGEDQQLPPEPKLEQ